MYGEGINELKCESLSGSLSFIGSVGADAEVELKAHSGDITLALPATVSADFSLFSFSGDIRNTLTAERAAQPRGPGTMLDMSLNDGSARIEAKAFSGDVHLKTL